MFLAIIIQCDEASACACAIAYPQRHRALGACVCEGVVWYGVVCAPELPKKWMMKTRKSLQMNRPGMGLSRHLLRHQAGTATRCILEGSTCWSSSRLSCCSRASPGWPLEPSLTSLSSILALRMMTSHLLQVDLAMLSLSIIGLHVPGTWGWIVKCIRKAMILISFSPTHYYLSMELHQLYKAWVKRLSFL